MPRTGNLYARSQNFTAVLQPDNKIMLSRHNEDGSSSGYCEGEWNGSIADLTREVSGEIVAELEAMLVVKIEEAPVQEEAND